MLLHPAPFSSPSHTMPFPKSSSFDGSPSNFPPFHGDTGGVFKFRQRQPCAREQGLVPGLSRLLCTKSRMGSLIAVGPLACAGCPVVFVHLEQPLPSWRWCGWHNPPWVPLCAAALGQVQQLLRTLILSVFADLTGLLVARAYGFGGYLSAHTLPLSGMVFSGNCFSILTLRSLENTNTSTHTDGLFWQ